MIKRLNSNGNSHNAQELYEQFGGARQVEDDQTSMHALPRVFTGPSRQGSSKHSNTVGHSAMMHQKPSQITLSRDSSQKLIMPMISQTPLFNTSALLQQQGNYTDVQQFPSTIITRPKGSIYSMRDQKKVVGIITKRFVEQAKSPKSTREYVLAQTEKHRKKNVASPAAQQRQARSPQPKASFITAALGQQSNLESQESIKQGSQDEGSPEGGAFRKIEAADQCGYNSQNVSTLTTKVVDEQQRGVSPFAPHSARHSLPIVANNSLPQRSRQDNHFGSARKSEKQHGSSLDSQGPFWQPNFSQSANNKKALPKLPNRDQMIQAIELTRDADQLIQVFENRYALKQAIKEDARRKRMVGRANYELPNLQKLKKTVSKHNEDENLQFVEKISNNIAPMQGITNRLLDSFERREKNHADRAKFQSSLPAADREKLRQVKVIQAKQKLTQAVKDRRDQIRKESIFAGSALNPSKSLQRSRDAKMESKTSSKVLKHLQRTNFQK